MAAKRITLFKVAIRACGKSSLPLDMLRYDQCWPASEMETAKIQALEHQKYPAETVVEFASWAAGTPTVGRWESFGCRVVEVNGRKV